MARVTVEDCIEVVNNRFELVLLAAQRARDISAGQMLLVERDNDKNPVVALREIADRLVNLDELKGHIVRGVNRHSDLNPEDAALAAMQAQDGWPTLESLGIAPEELPNIEEVSFDDAGKPAEAAEEGEPTDEDIIMEASDFDGDLDDSSAAV